MYHRLTFLVPADREDELTAELWLRGTLGVELESATGDELRVHAYFAEPLPELAQLEDEGWAQLGFALQASLLLPEEDWLANYRATVQPIEVGRSLTLDPREPGSPPLPVAAGRYLLRIPARAAFGTGSHETTRLVLELIEESPVRGRRVVDVGTGSGVLAFAALVQGASFVVGVEVDPQAALLAGLNRHLNRLQPALVVGAVGCLRAGPRFDVALVNVLPEDVEGDLEELSAVLAEGARAVFSGILCERRDEVGARLAAHGFRVRQQRTLGDWVALDTDLARS